MQPYEICRDLTIASYKITGLVSYFTGSKYDALVHGIWRERQHRIKRKLRRDYIILIKLAHVLKHISPTAIFKCINHRVSVRSSCSCSSFLYPPNQTTYGTHNILILHSTYRLYTQRL